MPSLKKNPEVIELIDAATEKASTAATKAENKRCVGIVKESAEELSSEFDPKIVKAVVKRIGDNLKQKAA